MFSGFGLKSTASGFRSYFSSSLKASPIIQHSLQGYSEMKMKINE